MALGVGFGSPAASLSFAFSEEPMKVPCSPTLASQLISTPPGLQACLVNRCASEGSTAEPSPMVMSMTGSPRRPSSDSFSLPDGMVVSGESEMFSLYSSGHFEQASDSAEPAPEEVLGGRRRSFSALCIEPSQLMMLRGDADVHDKLPGGQDERARSSMRTFDGLCLEFNPARLPFLNASLHDSLPGKDEGTEEEEAEIPSESGAWGVWAHGLHDMNLGIYDGLSGKSASVIEGDYADALTTEDYYDACAYSNAHQWYQMLYGDAGHYEQYNEQPMDTLVEYP